MAKKISLFKCDICGTTYPDEGEAYICESSHTEAIRIKNTDYRPMLPYPKKIAVEFENGQTMMYYKANPMFKTGESTNSSAK